VTKESQGKQIVKDSQYIAQAMGDGAEAKVEVTHIHQYTGCLPTGAPFQAPPLPPHFIPRPEVSNALKSRLLTDETPAPGVPFDRAHGVLVVSAIHGLGGIGKSVLAAALAHDPQVQERFPDGVLWATLGQEPDLLSLLSAWVQALGDYDFRPTTLEAASAHLRTLLHDKAALLVVDDVWDPEHTLPFKTGGPRCQVLITTRRADVADEVGADLYQLDVMTLEQSLGLLTARLGRTLEETERDEALRLAEAVGYLPLALELAATRIARGVAWEALREALEEEIARLDALEGPRARRTGLKLEASFNLSLDALRAENEEAWRAFAWLGVLPEDVAVTAPMAATLWEMDQTEAAETLELLWNDALLLPGSPVRIGEGRWSGYRLHDLLHDSARRLLTAPPEPRRARDLPGLGLTLLEAHAHLLARYQAQTQDGLWHTLPDDGYVHAHLAWHLERAGWTDELRALLREETPAGRNGWYEARERLGQTADFLSDLDRSWRAAERADAEATASGALAPHLGDQVRCALCQASINSLAANIPPELLAALVENGIWTPAQGLTYARQMPGELSRSKALTALALHLPAELMGEALAAARGIAEGLRRAETLAGLAPHLPVELMGEALAAARGIEDEGWRVYALAGLAPHLPAGLLGEALAAVRRIKVEWIRTDALVGLAPHLPAGEREAVLAETLAVAREVANERIRADALRGLAPHLPVELMGEALAAARGIEDEEDRAEALVGLAPHLPVGEREAVLGEALAAARGVANERWQAETLAELAPHLSPGLLGEALVAALGIEDEEDRAEALVGLAPHLPAELMGEALTAARGIVDERWRAEALVGLAPHLPVGEREAVLAKALAAAQGVAEGRIYELEGRPEKGLFHRFWAAIWHVFRRKTLKRTLESSEMMAPLQDLHAPVTDDESRAVALAGLAPHLSAELMGEALAAARGIAEGLRRAETLAGLAPHLPVELMGEALAAGIADGRWRVEALAGLAPHLPPGLLGEALAVARGIAQEESRAEALAGLAPHLPVELLGEALAAARGIADERWRAEALARLAPHLPVELMGEALATAWGTEDEGWRVYALVGLAPHLPAGLLGEALAAVRRIKVGWILAYALVGLAPHLPAELMGEALAAARGIEDKRDRASALTGLAPHLPTDLLGEALAVAREVANERIRANALRGLAPHLPVELMGEALATARGTEDEGWRVEALAGLAPHLPTGLLGEALAVAREAANERIRANALRGLAPHLPAGEREAVLGEALAAARGIEDEEDRAEALVGLAPHLPAGEREAVLGEALAAARGMKSEWSRAEALVGLAPHLPAGEREAVLGEALAAARGMKSEWSQIFTLVELAPHLPAGEREVWLAEALAATREMKYEESRAEALAALAPHLPAELMGKALVATRRMVNERRRAAALAALAPYLAAFPRPALGRWWLEEQQGANLLHFLARRMRRNLLADLAALAPVIHALGDEDAIAETFRAIQDVGRWWP
jgi:hypothetical protein